MSLFCSGSFQLHSGRTSIFKIDCESLTMEDWKTLAAIVADSIKFGRVLGVPRGGLPFEQALIPHITRGHERVLLVDDVLTTGGSMEEMRRKIGASHVRGVVVFARGKCPSWIQPIFAYRFNREL